MTDTPSPLPSAGSPILSDHSLQHAISPSTRILTCEGEMPAGRLQVGQRIITRDMGVGILRGLITRTPARPLKIVRIPAHAFGRNRPERPVELLADQPVLIRDARAELIWGKKSVRVAASRLIDGQLVKGVKRDPGPLIALHFSKPAIIYANGMEIISAGVETVQRKAT